MPEEISKNPKVCQTNGNLCYPPKYFTNTESPKQTLALYPIFNTKQAKQEIKKDPFNNSNYIRKGAFYVHNYKFSNVF